MPPRPSLAALAFALALAGTCGSSRADSNTDRLARSYVGVQGLVIVGDHQDAAGTQHGVGGAPLIEVRLGVPRFALHLEGVPVISAPQRASAFYGQATPALGLFNGSVEGAIDSHKRIWLGVGTTIINQRTPLPNIFQVVSSRLAGARYTFRADEPLRSPGHFIEADFGVAPSLSGDDIYLYSNGHAAVDENERASELDASLAFGWQHRDSQWLVGFRALNFTARYTATGAAADRNVGIGPIIEWRHLLSH